MKIKANTLKRAKRLRAALASGRVDSREFGPKIDRLLGSGSFTNDAHAGILIALANRRGVVCTYVDRPHEQVELWRARGFGARLTHAAPGTPVLSVARIAIWGWAL